MNLSFLDIFYFYISFYKSKNSRVKILELLRKLETPNYIVINIYDCHSNENPEFIVKPEKHTCKL